MLQNPSNLYSSGQVNLDSTPFVKFALQQEAQKKAKDEALDKFFAEKNAKLTTTGMRESEIAPLSQVKTQLQNFWLKNRDNIHNISKDNGKAWGEYNKLFNTAQSIIDNSKAAAKITDEIGKIKATHPELVDRMDENTLTGLDQHSQPIYIVGQNGQIVENPKFKPFDFNSITYNPKGYDAKQMSQYLEDKKKFFPPDVSKEDIQATKDPYVNRIVTTYDYTPNTLKQIGEEARQDFKTDKNLAWTVKQEHDLLKTPFNQWKQDHVDKFNQLNAEYKKIYGQDIQKDEDLHVAETLAAIKSSAKPKDEFRSNEAKKYSDKEKLLKKAHEYTTARMRERARLGLDNDPSTQGVAFDEIGGESDVDVFTTDSKFGIPFAKKGGRISKGIVFGADGDVMADGEITIDKDKLPANMIVVLNSQKTRLPNKVIATVKNGQIESVKSENAGVVSRESMVNFQKGYNKEPQKGSQLQFGKKATVPTSTKKVKVKGL